MFKITRFDPRIAGEVNQGYFFPNKREFKERQFFSNGFLLERLWTINTLNYLNLDKYFNSDQVDEGQDQSCHPKETPVRFGFITVMFYMVIYCT